jgi:gas vesicle protein
MSNNNFIAGIAIGAAIGSVASWLFVKKKYERIVQEEVESVRAAFERYHTEVEKIILSEPGECEPAPKEVVKEEYKEIISDSSYSKGNLNNDCSDPYVIAPEELGGEEGEYNILSLTYFSDGVLADDTGEIFNIAGSIGEDALEHFGEYEDEAVHVRNESWNTDFEIFLDERKYSEVY